MQYTNFGNTGLIISRLCFGAMTFGVGDLVGELKSSIGQDIADEMIKKSLDAGINFFDTADMYTAGQSESILGKTLKDIRKDVVIATKCGFRSSESIISTGLSYRYITQSVENSLKRLGTDYIDLFQLHVPDPHTPLEETARALDYVINSGMVRYAGYSNFPAWQAQKLLDIQELNGMAKVISAQMYYSLLGRDIEENTVQFLEANNLGLMTWSPLAGGFLTGKYTKENPIPEDSRRAKFDFPPIDIEKGYDVVAKLKEIGNAHEASIAQVALAWQLAKPYVSSVIIGANKMSQLEDNLGAVNIKLSDEEVNQLDDLTAIPQRYPAYFIPFGHDQKVKEALNR